MAFQMHNRWAWIVLLSIITLTSAIRVRLLSVPLERDEGEYAYAGQLILQGISPYAEVYNMKLPGIYAAYAGILFVFGQTQSGIHIGLLFINIATILVFFCLIKKLFGQFIGAAAAIAFAILSLEPTVLGTFAHAEHFVLLPAVAGIWLLVCGLDSKKNLPVFCGAFLLGLAFIMKQPGLAFAVFGAIYLVYRMASSHPFNRKDFILKSSLFIIGVSLPFAITCLILWHCGVFGKFWFWTFDYAREYVSAVSFTVGMEIFRNQITQIIGSAILIWLLAAVGVIALFLNKNFRPHRVLVLGFLCFSFLAVCPGFYFRNHYFIFFLPAVALLAGLGLGSAIELTGRSKHFAISGILPALIILAVLFHSFYQQRRFFFVMSPTVVSRETFGHNPFFESLEIAKYIEEHSNKNDRIAILGSEPQICFYAKRHSATGYIYTYPLMELHPYASKMQQDMIREIETAKPRFIIFVHVVTSWLMSSRSDASLLNWCQGYIDTNYKLVGAVEITPQAAPIYKWGENACNIGPQSEYWLTVYERKTP